MTGALIYILKNDGNVSAITTDIYPVFAPKNVSQPFVIVECDGIKATQIQSTVSKLDEYSMSVSVFDRDYSVAKNLANTIETALQRYSGTVTSGSTVWRVQSTQLESRDEDLRRGTGDEGISMIELSYKCRAMRTPLVSAATVAIDENTSNGTSVTTVTAVDDQSGLTYAITSGNSLGGFTINSSTGEITVADSTQLDYETTPTFNLVVTVTDRDGLTDYNTITVNLNDVAESNYSAEGQAVIDLMTGINTTQETAIDTLVSTLVTSGDWAELDTFIMHIGLGSEANSIIDWKGTQDALRVNSPGWTNAGGFTSDGSTSYIDYQKLENAYTKYINGDASVFYGIGSGGIGSGTSYAGGNVRTNVTATTITNARVKMNKGNGSLNQTIVNWGAGQMISSRRYDTSNYQSWVDGVLGVDGALASQGLLAFSFFGLCWSNNGTASGFMESGQGITFKAVGSSSINHLNIYNAFEQFKTDLGI